MKHGRAFLLLTHALSAAGLLVLANADAGAGVKEGEALARRSCSICHAVVGKSPSPNKDAPAFTAIARNSAFRKKGSAYILGVHPKMPNLAIAADDARDLAAYIRTLRR